MTTPQGMARQLERLLDQIRGRVAELRRLERAPGDPRELRRRRRELAELQWRLARFVRRHPGGGGLAA
jgi:hypothetical protein